MNIYEMQIYLLDISLITSIKLNILLNHGNILFRFVPLFYFNSYALVPSKQFNEKVLCTNIHYQWIIWFGSNLYQEICFFFFQFFLSFPPPYSVMISWTAYFVKLFGGFIKNKRNANNPNLWTFFFQSISSKILKGIRLPSD